jgi:ribosome-binding ATPase YchF (GTP1/OBG family)
MSKNSSAALTIAEKSEVKIVPMQRIIQEPEKTEVKNLSIEDLKNRAVALALLNQKHDDLTEKRKRLERFSIVHDHNNAQITVMDARGEEFVSGSPKSIKRLIEFWQDEFREAIAENEEQIKKMFA